MSLALVASDRFSAHSPPPGHPERSARSEVMSACAARWSGQGGTVLAPRPATREELERVHSGEYVELIGSTAGRAVALDPDTHTSPETSELALLAAGAALVAVEHTLTGTGPAFALVRPPGHHAERDRAMGFCFYNSVAVAAARALADGLTRVAIVDFDVHHGNGTQWMFYEDPRVLYASVHQYPFYPGTGAIDEAGHGAGLGRTVNVPLAAGATDADYDIVFDRILIPVLRAFSPELLLVSAGYDAHRDDPLGGMRVTTAGFTSMAAKLRAVARERADDRIAFVTEGGYDLGALEAGLEATIEVLAASQVPPPRPAAGATDRARAALDAVLTLQRRHWAGL